MLNLPLQFGKISRMVFIVLASLLPIACSTNSTNLSNPQVIATDAGQQAKTIDKKNPFYSVMKSLGMFFYPPENLIEQWNLNWLAKQAAAESQATQQDSINLQKSLQASPATPSTQIMEPIQPAFPSNTDYPKLGTVPSRPVPLTAEQTAAFMSQIRTEQEQLQLFPLMAAANQLTNVDAPLAGQMKSAAAIPLTAAPLPPKPNLAAALAPPILDPQDQTVEQSVIAGEPIKIAVVHFAKDSIQLNLESRAVLALVAQWEAKNHQLLSLKISPVSDTEVKPKTKNQKQNQNRNQASEKLATQRLAAVRQELLKLGVVERYISQAFDPQLQPSDGLVISAEVWTAKKPNP